MSNIIKNGSDNMINISYQGPFTILSSAPMNYSVTINNIPGIRQVASKVLTNTKALSRNDNRDDIKVKS